MKEFFEREGEGLSNMEYRLTGEVIERFKHESFVNLGQLFTLDEVERVRSAFHEMMSEQSVGGVEIIREGGPETPVRSVMGWEHASPLLDHFTRDARVLAAVQSLIGDNVVLHQTKYNPKAPSGKGEKWDPHRGITFWHYLDGVPDPGRMVSVFIALTEQTVENGAVVTWKAAHNLTLEQLQEETDFGNRHEEGDTQKDTAPTLSLQIRPENIEGYTQTFEKVDLVGPPGTVWLLDSRNLHASAPNNSPSVRELVANVYRSAGNVPATPRGKEFLCSTSNTPLRPFVAGKDGEL